MAILQLWQTELPTQAILSTVFKGLFPRCPEFQHPLVIALLLGSYSKIIYCKNISININCMASSLILSIKVIAILEVNVWSKRLIKNNPIFIILFRKKSCHFCRKLIFIIFIIFIDKNDKNWVIFIMIFINDFYQMIFIKQPWPHATPTGRD